MQEQPEISPIQSEAEKYAKDALTLLTSKAFHVNEKYEYYDADNDTRDFGIATPKRFNNTKPGVGWASRAVNTLSDRVVFDGFANDTYGINDYLEQIGGMSIIQKAKHDTGIGGCSFIAVAQDEDGNKILVPFTAMEATGEINQTTGLLKWGLAVTRWAEPKPKKRGVNFVPADYVLFTPEYTAVFEDRTFYDIYPNETGRTLLHPLTHRASANKPLGKSRLTKTARRIIQEVGRLKRREEIAEEFYGLPQRYIVGLADGAKKDDALDSAIGKVWTITKDEDGDSPTVGQLQQMSIDGFVAAKKDKARDFCAETALTLRNLGYETGNPTSAESLSAMSDDLLLEASNWQEELGKQIKELVITLRMAMDGTAVVPTQLKALVPAWKPIFQLDVGAAGDAAVKIQQAAPEMVGTLAYYRLLGASVREAEELIKRRQQMTQASFMQSGGQ